MTAYAIGHLEVRDPAWMEEYRPKVAALIEKHGGRYLAAGGAMETLEGTAALPSGLVVLEFPSMAEAKAWYADADYAPMIALRQSGSDLDLVLVDGI